MNPDVDKILESYKSLQPKNRKERSKLLHRQGWYYQVLYNYEGEDWTVWQVHTSGDVIIKDRSSNYDTNEVKE